MPDLSIALVTLYCYRFHGILCDAADSRYWQKRQKRHENLTGSGQCVLVNLRNGTTTGKAAKILVNWERNQRIDREMLTP